MDSLSEKARLLKERPSQSSLDDLGLHAFQLTASRFYTELTPLTETLKRYVEGIVWVSPLTDVKAVYLNHRFYTRHFKNSSRDSFNASDSFNVSSLKRPFICRMEYVCYEDFRLQKILSYVYEYL